MSPPTLFFSFKIVLTILIHLNILVDEDNFRIILSLSTKSQLGF